MELVTRLNSVIASAPGRWGVALIDPAGELGYGWQEHMVFPSASLIKVPLAWHCLELHADDVLDLDLLYPLQPEDICDPDGSLARLEPGTRIAWRDLLRVMITESENNATNILLHLVGVQTANEWLDARGWTATRWRRKMLDFAARQQGIDNTTTAYEMAALLTAFRHALPDAQLEPLHRWLLESEKTQKLDAGLPPGTPLAHKVGDLPGGVEHDAGIITLPGGAWYTLAVLAADTPDIAQTRAISAEISRQCWEWFAKRY